MNDAWIAGRMKQIDVSGIRKAFDMAKSMRDPINLSIGLPDFDVAEPVKTAAIAAIEAGRNAYTVTQGIPELRGKIQAAVQDELHHADREVLVTAGTSGALLLAICCVVDPGDELITFDPCFMMYRHLATLAGGRTVLVETYPDFRIDAARVERAITSRTKCVVVNSPASPTGAVASVEEMRSLGGGLPAPGRAFDQRRGLQGVLLRSSVRDAGDLERTCAGRQRVQQVARHDRLAAGLCPWPGPFDSGNGQASAIQLRVRAEHGAAWGRCGRR